MIYNFDTTYTQLDHSLFQFLSPPDIQNPNIVLLNRDLLQELGINLCEKNFAKELLGQNMAEQPFAQAYAGHQFGFFNNLGDGRAMILGEHITFDNKRFDIQLKGSGRTKYSRNGDGKATMSSMLREYLYSYTMRKLNIESSQSLAVISTNEKVLREQISEGAILVRIMKSHIRFGTFEYVSKACSKEDFQAFADYVMNRHYPDLTNEEDKYLCFFRAVMQKTIQMVVDWYRVGFIHGVMNTDNMSITGETFDYGPCSFINRYDPSTTFSKIDRYKRYAFGNQKEILQWNLHVFAETLLPIIGTNRDESISIIHNELQSFDRKFDAEFYKMMNKKLGIADEKGHKELVDKLLSLMAANQLDYTHTFIELMDPGTFTDAGYLSKEFIDLRGEIKKVGLQVDLMKKSNPQIILRNHFVEEALNEYDNTNKMSKIEELLDALSNPYAINRHFEKFQQPPSLSFDENYMTHCNT